MTHAWSGDNLSQRRAAKDLGYVAEKRDTGKQAKYKQLRVLSSSQSNLMSQLIIFKYFGIWGAASCAYLDCDFKETTRLP